MPECKQHGWHILPGGLDLPCPWPEHGAPDRLRMVVLQESTADLFTGDPSTPLAVNYEEFYRSRVAVGGIAGAVMLAWLWRKSPSTAQDAAPEIYALDHRIPALEFYRRLIRALRLARSVADRMALYIGPDPNAQQLLRDLNGMLRIAEDQAPHKEAALGTEVEP